jgi:ribosomal protein S18 acetylase RimI-like enzyme
VDIPKVSFRDGGPDDLPWLLGLFDEAIEWMVARGQTGQWGTEPMSQTERGRASATRLCGGDGLRVAALDGDQVAALVVGDEPPPHVDRIDEPELYIHLLLVSRRHAGRRIGEALVDRAIDEGRERDRPVLRVDCWAGAPTLVSWYEARGFQRAGTFDVTDGWVGQVFAMDLGARR